MTNIFIAPSIYVCESILFSRYLSDMEKNIIQVVLSIQVQFLFGEQRNKQINFREQGNKRKIILRNKAIYFKGTGADFSGEQVAPPPQEGLTIH